MKKQNSGMGKAVAIGAGVAAATAAAYIMFGPNAKKNKKAIKGWAVKMKGEMIEKMEGVKELSQETYDEVVDNVKSKYSKLKNIDRAELESIAKDAKKHWKSIVQDSKPKTRSTKGTKRG
jgi:hypothetical protein